MNCHWEWIGNVESFNFRSQALAAFTHCLSFTHASLVPAQKLRSQTRPDPRFIMVLTTTTDNHAGACGELPAEPNAVTPR